MFCQNRRSKLDGLAGAITASLMGPTTLCSQLGCIKLDSFAALPISITFAFVNYDVSPNSLFAIVQLLDILYIYIYGRKTS